MQKKQRIVRSNKSCSTHFVQVYIKMRVKSSRSCLEKMSKQKYFKIHAFPRDYSVTPSSSCNREVLCAVVEICIFRNTKERGQRDPRRNLLVACFSRYLESSADDTVHVCGLKRVRSELSRYKPESGEKRFTRAAEFLLEPVDLTKLIAADRNETSIFVNKARKV